MRSILRAQKTLLEQNTTKARSADWCFVEAKPPTGGAAYTVLLYAGFLLLLLYLFSISFFNAFLLILYSLKNQ
jgi:hypothetical protein